MREARLGSVPPETVVELAVSGVRQVVSEQGVDHVRRSPDGLHVALRGGSHVLADQVWLATGHAFDLRFDPLTAKLLAEVPLPVVDGLPVLDDDLSWAGTAVHLTGGLASLQVGPAARNLVGARIAAERMVGRVSGREPERRHYPVPAGRGARRVPRSRRRGQVSSIAPCPTPSGYRLP